MMPQRLIRFGANLRGWQRGGMALLSGLMAGLALPPFYVLPLLIPAFCGLYLLLETSPRLRGALSVGWWFGAGFFALGFYWIGYAFFVDQARHGWMAPFAVGGMAAGLAVFPLITAGLFYRLSQFFPGTSAAPAAEISADTSGTDIRSKMIPSKVILFVCLWTGVEWLRGWVLTGLPWNMIGTVWGVSEPMMQGAALVGVPGLGLITLLVALSPMMLGTAQGKQAAIGFTAVLIASGIWGSLRLPTEAIETVEGVRLRLVQPNIPQRLKWQRDLRASHVRQQIAMSRAPVADGDAPITHVIWAETSVPFVIDKPSGLEQTLAQAAPAGGQVVFGALRRQRSDDGRKAQVFNSLLAISETGQVTVTYDKVHLVPFGEYVPMRNLLARINLSKLTDGRGDFTIGAPLKPISIKGLPPVLPLICYEVVFADEVRSAIAGAGWMLNITNDGWFGDSSGPRQHLVAARFRALEQGRPLVRVANTGISAFIDPYGRIISRLELGQQGILDGDLPKALATTPVYGRFGNNIVLMLVLLLLAGAGVSVRKQTSHG